MFEKVFAELELSVDIKINNRKLLNGILSTAEIPTEKQESVILSLDKLEKVGWNGVEKELLDKKVKPDSIQKLRQAFESVEKGSNEQKLEKWAKIISSKEGLEGVKELREVLEISQGVGVKNLVFVPSLARGLAYYTSTVFEVFLKDLSKMSSSLVAGGRYNKMIAALMSRTGGDEIPAVGVGFGLDSIQAALQLKEQQKSVVKVFIIPIRTEKECFKVLSELRKNSINADMDFSQKSISKNFEFADKQKIPFALIIGENELKSGKLSLKNMNSGEEEKLSLNEIIEKLKD